MKLMEQNNGCFHEGHDRLYTVQYTVGYVYRRDNDRLQYTVHFILCFASLTKPHAIYIYNYLSSPLITKCKEAMPIHHSQQSMLINMLLIFCLISS